MSAFDAVETPTAAAAVPDDERRATGLQPLRKRRSEPVADDTVERGLAIAAPPATR